MGSKTKIQQAFYLFAPPKSKEKLPPTPFELDGYVYLTDGYSMIFCERSIIDFEITESKIIESVKKVIPSTTLNKVLYISDSDFEPFKTEDDYDIVGEDIICSECEGEGEVECEYKSYIKDFDCPKCKGRGYEQESKKVKNGLKTFNTYDMVNLNGTQFYMGLFYRLIKLKKIFDFDKEIILLSNESPTKAVIFGIGDLKILIMPNIYKEPNEDTRVLNLF